MNKLLTIAIPTYNRAELLDKQLAWLAQAIIGFESDCEILVSNNCSTDNTQEVIKKWHTIFSNMTFKSNKNSKNIGVMRNISYCLNTAKTKYIWTIGDDDIIHQKALAYVINTLKKEHDLSLLVLNFSVRDVETGEVCFKSTFDIENEEVKSDGKAFIESYLETDHRGLGFLTAQVYRTELVQGALKKWPSSVNNLEGQIYWTAFCAVQGNINITKETYVENVYAIYKPKLWFRMNYADLPQVYAKMRLIGYSKKFCRKLIIKHFAKYESRVVLGALKRWPLLAITTIIPYFTLIGLSALAIIFAL
ncbi:MAG: glycosyltransferase family 2 protein [Iphinoe sp. HA4291-MV1]|jgi:glycosyltransferase involved in cell wall biosynthesis|nr:glycosyltransferase family 2 protein [Iphinoe sp. HA4291-MV1]